MNQIIKAAPRTGMLFLACIIIFIVTIVLGIISSIGGPDAGLFFGYINFLLILFISLPLHLVSLVIIVYLGNKYSAWVKYFWFYVYVVIYLIVHILIFGPMLYEPAKKTLAGLTYQITHKKEVDLINQLRINPDPEVVKQLVEKGVDVNLPDRIFGFTPLIWAARAGNPGVVRILLDAGADPFIASEGIKASLGFRNTVTVSRLTPLTQAAWIEDANNRHTVVRIFLHSGVKPDTGSVLGACFFGDIDLLQIQLDAGAKLDVKDENNSTCLHQAVIGNRPDMIDFLIARNIKLDEKTKYGLTALDTAIEQWKSASILKLMQAGQYTERKESMQRFINKAPDSPEKDEIKRLYSVNPE